MILVVALVVLGPKRMPELARTLGKTLRGLRRASSDVRSAIEEPLREVREPLEEMRQDIYETVHHFEQEVERTVAEQEAEIRNALREPTEAQLTEGAAQPDEQQVPDSDPPQEPELTGQETVDPALLRADSEPNQLPDQSASAETEESRSPNKETVG